MTGSSRLLSELESAAMAGVSVETIRQFRGCGLLQPVNEHGEERFREIDISTLFYNRSKSNNSSAAMSSSQANSSTPANFSTTAPVTPNPLTSTAAGSSPVDSKTRPLNEQIVADFIATAPRNESFTFRDSFMKVTAPFAEADAVDSNKWVEETVAQRTASASPTDTTISNEGTKPSVQTMEASAKPTSETAVEAARMSTVEASTVEDSGGPVTASSTESTTETSGETSDYGETTFRTSAADPQSAKVIEMLPNPNNAINVEYLIEVNKGLREQIDILRGERDWLRSRVEKLETRSEREQMLLLSESENIRKLIQQNENRAFSWFRALPWFKDNRNIAK